MMNQQQHPMTVERLLSIYRTNPTDARLQPDDYLRIIAYYRDKGDKDSTENGIFAAGAFSGKYSKSILAGAFLEKGILAFAEKRYEDAILALTEAIAVDAESKHAYVVRAMCYSFSGRDDKGIRALEDYARAGRIARQQLGVSI